MAIRFTAKPVSYFKWVWDISSFFWDEDEINARLVKIMKNTFAGVGGAGAKSQSVNRHF